MKGDKIYAKATALFSRLIEGPSKVTEEKKKMYYELSNLLKRAAYLGHKDAMYDYAQQFEDIGYLGMENPLYNPKKRNYWYQKACEKGHAEAYNNLASIYEVGQGVEKDYAQAIELYRKAAELGSKLGKKNYKNILKKNG